MTKRNLLTIKQLVTQLLEEDEKCRNNDNHLILQVCKKKNPMVFGMNFADVINNADELGIPPFESIRRTRALVQSERPELCACDVVDRYRAQNEMVYREAMK